MGSGAHEGLTNFILNHFLCLCLRISSLSLDHQHHQHDRASSQVYQNSSSASLQVRDGHCRANNPSAQEERRASKEHHARHQRSIK